MGQGARKVFAFNIFAVNLISMFASECEMQQYGFYFALPSDRQEGTYCRCLHIKFKFQAFFSPRRIFIFFPASEIFNLIENLLDFHLEFQSL